jgi:uncharacterized repeat protein (TIGR03803 family)
MGITLPAQTFTTLFAFDGLDGQGPAAPLVQGTDGNLYGTTRNGGAHLDGTVFKITPTGTLTTLYSFCSKSECADRSGSAPGAALVLGADGNFYGTTGSGCCRSTVFKITPGGTLTTLFTFDGTDGEYPNAALVQAPNGDFYGTTPEGGAYGSGTIFRITPSGTLTTLYSFCPRLDNCTDGQFPNGLVLATDGDFYGTTSSGGTTINSCNGFNYYNCGTVFKITPSGTLTTLYSFCPQGGDHCPDGYSPSSGLVQATDGNFYGTTGAGGIEVCNPYQDCMSGGTVFRITPGGMLTTLYRFCSQGVYGNCTDGQAPSGLVQAANGDLYGTTRFGGAIGDNGTVFTIGPSGLTTLHSFCGAECTHGAWFPSAGLAQATNGDFYGVTGDGGEEQCDDHRRTCGTVFSLSVGAGPFVKILPALGPVGAAVNILGTDLAATTSVAFNGTVAAFEIVSATEITATVPAGATTGKVQVVTPSGTLTSNVLFQVK